MSPYIRARTRDDPVARALRDETVVVLGLMPYRHDFAWAVVEVDRIIARICKVRATGYVAALRAQTSANSRHWPALEQEQRRHWRIQALVELYGVEWIASVEPELTDINAAYDGGTFDGTLAAISLPIVQVSPAEMSDVSHREEWRTVCRHFVRDQRACDYGRHAQQRHRLTRAPGHRGPYEGAVSRDIAPLLVITTALRIAPICHL